MDSERVIKWVLSQTVLNQRYIFCIQFFAINPFADYSFIAALFIKSYGQTFQKD